MSHRQHVGAAFTRRRWVMLALSALSGCGGGSSGTAGLPGTGGTGSLALLPGTGGTGIYVQGSISGFGSVILNGIKFDDVQASANGLVKLDGVTSTSADLRLGMVAGVQGTRSTVATVGTANSIEVWSIAQGLALALVPGVTGAFQVAGMTVQTDSATVLEGISSVASLLSSAQRVVVWGLQAGADGRHWAATRVALLPSGATLTVNTGVVSVSSTHRYLNGLLLTGTLASSLNAGDLARVQGTLSSTGSSLAVTSLQLLGLGAGFSSSAEVEIEGVVTSMPSSSGFMLGSIQVDISSTTTYSPVGAQITQNARVEVYGRWQGGVLKATKVELESEMSLNDVEIEATIQEFTSVANFVVRGQRCDASGLTLSAPTLAGLQVGAKVHLKGVKAGEVLMVTELELGD